MTTSQSLINLDAVKIIAILGYIPPQRLDRTGNMGYNMCIGMRGAPSTLVSNHITLTDGSPLILTRHSLPGYASLRRYMSKGELSETSLRYIPARCTFIIPFSNACIQPC